MKDIITFADFQKLDLKVATILEVTQVEGSDKMLKIQIDLGDEKRQILASLGKVYTKEELIGKQLIVLTNLEPKKMMGEESQGMLLAADSNGEIAFLTTHKKMPSGAMVR